MYNELSKNASYLPIIIFNDVVTTYILNLETNKFVKNVKMVKKSM